jgi:hypothetical protein
MPFLATSAIVFAPRDGVVVVHNVIAIIRSSDVLVESNRLAALPLDGQTQNVRIQIAR